MSKQLSAVLAAAALTLSASVFANEPMSVNETGPVLTAAQEKYEADRLDAQGVAGRPGFAMESRIEGGDAAAYEVKTPSRGGPIDD